jgi:hypothetical protein
MAQWRPDEIIVHDKVRNDPVTTLLLEQYPGALLQYIGGSGEPRWPPPEARSKADRRLLYGIGERVAFGRSCARAVRINDRWK